MNGISVLVRASPTPCSLPRSQQVCNLEESPHQNLTKQPDLRLVPSRTVRNKFLFFYKASGLWYFICCIIVAQLRHQQKREKYWSWSSLKKKKIMLYTWKLIYYFMSVITQLKNTLRWKKKKKKGLSAPWCSWNKNKKKFSFSTPAPHPSYISLNFPISKCHHHRLSCSGP